MPLQEGKSILLSPPPSPKAWLGTTPGSPRSGRGCSSPWLVKRRQELLVLCAALSVITAHCKGGGTTRQRGTQKDQNGEEKLTRSDRKSKLLLLGGWQSALSSGASHQQHVPGLHQSVLGGREPSCASAHVCEHLCFRGQGKYLGSVVWQLASLHSSRSQLLFLLENSSGSVTLTPRATTPCSAKRMCTLETQTML